MLASRPISRNEEGIQRFGGAKTPARRGLQNENAIRNAPTTLGLKGNIPQTPFQPKSIKGDLQLKDVSQTGKAIQLNTVSRPFLDKTPFPNRVVSLHTQTPFNRDLSETPDSAQIPSSTRKHIRLPRHSQKFETPLNTKNHWDLADDEVQMAVQAIPPKVLDVKEDYDEVEYMPPNTLDLPYQPPLDFELPNYKEVGKVLMGISRNLALDESQPPPDIVPSAEDIVPIPWNMIPLPELEDDDPFGAARKKNPPSTKRNLSKPVRVPAVKHIRSASTTRLATPSDIRPNTHNPVPVPAVKHMRSASTTRLATSSHNRAPSVTTHSTRTAPKPVIAKGRAAVGVTVKSTSRRPATSASTYKLGRGVSGASSTGPRVVTEDAIALTVDLLKSDENEDFLFDV